MPNPLVMHHESMGARLEQGRIPLSYTTPVEEYWAIRNHSGIADVSHLGLLQVTGKERLSFLNGLLTNEILKLTEGTGIRSALLNTKARVLADLHLYAREDDLLIDTGDVPGASVRDILELFIITEDVQVKDITPGFVHLTLQGQQASQNARELFGVTFADMKPLQHKMLGPTMIVNRDRTGQLGYDLLIPNGEAEAVWQSFLLKGVTPVGREALEILRLEAGYPRYGIDVDENTIILEAGYKDAISFNKGCYLGQEVVARATHIGRVNKNLIQFQTDSDNVPSVKSKFISSGKEAGYVTSAAFSPGLKVVVGLGYAQRDFAKEGTKLVIESENGPLPTVITKLA
ncbi:aminomethyl transferase family protein [Candidatus Bathyarchaeota archaeon]|nr:MAG: aminomethyl transferase family protein [Candidatus Bathyarchaeota archaeon]